MVSVSPHNNTQENEMSNTMHDGIDFHQTLMDRAYARWQKGGDLAGASWNDFVWGLDPTQKKAVLLGKYIQQVNNGGHLQWVGNGYIETQDSLMWTLQDMGDRGYLLAGPAAKAVGECSRAYNRAEDLDDWDEDYDQKYDEILDLDHLDDLFYEIADAFEIQCEFYLREIAERAVTDADRERHADALAMDLRTVIKRPRPTVRLIGTDGNAFSVIARASKALRQADYSREEIKRFREQAMSGDYDKVLATVHEWCIIE